MKACVPTLSSLMIFVVTFALSCVERGMDGRLRISTNENAFGPPGAEDSAELPLDDPRGFELRWHNPDDGLCSSEVRVQDSNSGKTYYLKQSGPLFQVRKLRPGRVTLRLSCKDTKQGWLPKHRQLIKGRREEYGGDYRTESFITNSGMNFAHVPAGASLHICIYVGPGGVGNGRREYRLAAVEDLRYCSALRKLTDHFALPFVVNMLEYE